MKLNDSRKVSNHGLFLRFVMLRHLILKGLLQIVPHYFKKRTGHIFAQRRENQTEEIKTVKSHNQDAEFCGHGSQIIKQDKKISHFHSLKRFRFKPRCYKSQISSLELLIIK
ncbi:hypothetical protein CDL12_06289 [Handroanthus impetiginosus]|uniref:Uncharacterized protein n=1 Tax=Handroanthus impetiginosus TaxID=429701 RepID=A0A2G9HU24_9LAMI|nr:hypothetical protein CDL12_06289 [Handroanthus impetiginosus]